MSTSLLWTDAFMRYQLEKYKISHGVSIQNARNQRRAENLNGRRVQDTVTVGRDCNQIVAMTHLGLYAVSESPSLNDDGRLVEDTHKHTHKLASIPCGIKVGILRRGQIDSCQSFVLEQLPLLLLSRQVSDHERADESNVQGEYNGVPGWREQPNQWPRTYNRIQHSNRYDLQKKQGKKSNIVEHTIETAKQPSSGNEFQNSKLTQILPLTPT